MTREEAIKILEEEAEFLYGGDEPYNKIAFDMAKKALSADAEPTGEWIDIDNYYSMATCSHCHKVTMFEKWGEYIRPYNFCPNCGAKMYKGGEDE